MRIKLNLTANKNIPQKYQKIVFPINTRCILVQDLKRRICMFIMTLIGHEFTINNVNLYIQNCIVLDQFETSKIIRENDII